MVKNTENLNNVIKSNQQANSKNITNNIHIKTAIVVNVTTDYSYATVKIIGNNGTIIKLINKTGEKLFIGDSVRVYYSTNLSCGWIAMRNGKPEPLGGTNLEIDNAAVVPVVDPSKYLSNSTVFNVDVNNQIKCCYGDQRNRIIIDKCLTPVKIGGFDVPMNVGSGSAWYQFIIPKDVYISEGFSTDTFIFASDKDIQFFKDNKNCITSQIHRIDDDYYIDFYLKEVSMRSYTTKDKTATYSSVIYVFRSRLYWYRDDGSISVSTSGDVYCNQMPTDIGVMPVVTELGNKANVRYYLVMYNNDEVISAGKVLYPHEHTIDKDSDEYNYIYNVQKRGELRPSHNAIFT